ncbi:nitroreductase family protein [Natronospora cellulosivora (SeqCode)]
MEVIRQCSHMVLAALEHGVFSTWVSYFKVDQVSKVLGLPNNILASEIAFGYPARKKNPVKKKSIEKLVFYNNYKEERSI